MQSLIRFLSEQSWSANTADRYLRALKLLLAETQPAELTAQSFRAWLDGHAWGPSAQWVAYTAVKNYLRWRYGADHPALALKLKRVEAAPQRSLRLEQVRALMAGFDTGAPKGRRDLAMLGVFLDAGLRVSEMCRLSLRYLDLATQSLQVIVKGGKWSKRVYSAYTANWLSAWLADRERIAAPGVEAVFIGIGGNTPGQEMTRHGLQCVVRAWGKRAGLGKLSPHDFRRSMGSITTVLGAPEEIAMKAGGWHDPRVFRRYTVGVTVEDVRPYFPTAGAMEK